MMAADPIGPAHLHDPLVVVRLAISLPLPAPLSRKSRLH